MKQVIGDILTKRDYQMNEIGDYKKEVYIPKKFIWLFKYNYTKGVTVSLFSDSWAICVKDEDGLFLLVKEFYHNQTSEKIQSILDNIEGS